MAKLLMVDLMTAQNPGSTDAAAYAMLKRLTE